MCCGLTQQAVKYHVVAPSPSPISEMKERIGKKKKKMKWKSRIEIKVYLLRQTRRRKGK